MGWVTPDHPTPAELDACVQCGLCLPYCPTFRLTGEETASPRGRLTAMAAVAAGEVPVDDVFDDMMTFCLQCRACEAVCPSLVPFGRAMEGTRAELTAQRPGPSRRARRTVLGGLLGRRAAVGAASIGVAAAQRLRLDRLGAGPFARLSGFRSLPLSPATVVGESWEPIGPALGTVALLAGCVMDRWFSAVHVATAEVLRRAGYRVEVPEEQTCCGALAAHEGAASDARRMARRNVGAFENYDLVVVDAAGCGAHLKDYAHWDPDGHSLASRVRDVTEIVAELIDQGHLPQCEPTGIPVAVQDPCHLRHAQRITEQPRLLVRAAGFVPVDIDEQGLCCGAAGTYSLQYPGTSAQLGRNKADEVTATGATVVASANPGCELQLRQYLGRRYDVVHPVELYWKAIAAGR